MRFFFIFSMATRDFLHIDYDLGSDCIFDDDSEYIPSSGTLDDSCDEIQPFPRKKKCASSKKKSSRKPSTSRSLALDDADSDDDIPLACLV